MTLSKLLKDKKIYLIGTPIILLGIYYYRSRKTIPKEPQQEQESSASLKEKGNKLFKQGKYEEALVLYTKAIENCDQDQLEMLYQNRAAVFEKLGNYNSVIRETTSALSINPKYVKALHRRSKAYKQTGFLDEALEDITAVCILEQFSSPASVQHADDILKELGAQEGTKLLNSRSRTLQPGKHTVKAYLRGFYNCPVKDCELLKEDYDTIIDNCTEALKENQTNELYYLRATFRFLYGASPELVVQDFQKVIDSGDAKYGAAAYIKLACHYALLGDFEQCEDCFNKSGGLFEDNVDLYHQRGQVLLTRGSLPTALEEMEKAASLQPDWPIAVATKWYVQYRILGSTGDISGADACVKEFAKLVKKFPSSPDVFSLYGQILMENGLFTEAELNFSRVLELDPTNASVIVHSAMAKFQNGGNDSQVAIDMLKKAVAIDDRNEFVYETLGTLHLQIGELDSAIFYISKAISLARSHQELTILSSLKKAAEVQKKVKEKLDIQVQPGFFK